MDALGSIKPVVSQPVVARPAPAPSAPSAPSSQPAVKIGGGGGADQQIGFDALATDQKFYEALKSAAADVPQPLGSQVFTMYKNGSGQTITRFRDLNTGKVTYIPAENVFDMASKKQTAQSLVNMKV